MTTFNFTGNGHSAVYLNFTDEIIINVSSIMKCNKIIDNEKIEIITWQIEHEIIHSILYKYHTAQISHQFNNIAFLIRDKKNFDKILAIGKKVGYKYHGRKG